MCDSLRRFVHMKISAKSDGCPMLVPNSSFDITYTQTIQKQRYNTKNDEKKTLTLLILM